MFRHVEQGHGRVESQGDVLVLTGQALEVARREGNEVVDMGFVLNPANRFQARVCVEGLGEFSSVGQYRHVLGHAAGNLRGEAFVGVVIVGKPVLRLVGFALSE